MHVVVDQQWQKSNCPAIEPGDKLEIYVYGGGGYFRPTVNNDLTVNIPSNYKGVELIIVSLGSYSSNWTTAQEGGQFLLQCDL